MLNWAYLSGHVPDCQDFHETGTAEKVWASSLQGWFVGGDAAALA